MAGWAASGRDAEGEESGSGWQRGHGSCDMFCRVVGPSVLGWAARVVPDGPWLGRASNRCGHTRLSEKVCGSEGDVGRGCPRPQCARADDDDASTTVPGSSRVPAFRFNSDQAAARRLSLRCKREAPDQSRDASGATCGAAACGGHVGSHGPWPRATPPSLRLSRARSRPVAPPPPAVPARPPTGPAGV